MASVLCLLYLQPFGGARQETNTWQQDAFWISFWVGPQVAEAQLDERFAELAEANFTGYLGFNGGGSPFTPNRSRVTAEISLCEKYRLRCVPSLCGTKRGSSAVSPCAELGRASSTFWGWQLLDEPFPKCPAPCSNPYDYSRIGDWVHKLANVAPNALRYINLEGAGDYHHFPTLEHYAEYVQSFVEGVRPQVLSMDFYPYFAEDAAACPPGNADHCRDTKAMYGDTLSVLRTAAELAPHGPIPFWNFFNAMPYDHMHQDPTEAMLRWQAMTALTYGASGVMYFCYWSPSVFALGGGLIVPQGTKDHIEWVRGPHWYEAQRINSVLKIYGDFLLGRPSAGVFRAISDGILHKPFHVEYGASNNTEAADCAVVGLSNSGLRAGLDRPSQWLLGQFKLDVTPRWGSVRRAVTPPSSHSIALLLQNQDENRNVWSTLQWARWVNVSSILELDRVHGVLRPFRDDSPWSAGHQVAIDAGDARLFVIQATGLVPPTPTPSPLPPMPPVPPPPTPPMINNSIHTFGYYWAMQDGSNNMSASNGRNCSGSDCSWAHANAAFVQNSWKHPERWTSNSSYWDLSDCRELANRSVGCIVSVSHVFLSGPTAITTLPDFEKRWHTYLEMMRPVLHNVRAWYPSDEPDLRMPAATLQVIVDVLKRDTPSIDILVTLSNLAIPPNQPGRQYFNLTDIPKTVDIVTFDMYCSPVTVAACGSKWNDTILPKLNSLANFAEHNPAMRTAVIPDATLQTYSTIGGGSQRALNNLFVLWCAQQSSCVAVLPFVGGHWADIRGQSETYNALVDIGDATRTGIWNKTIIGATDTFSCPLGGELTNVTCVDHGCDYTLLPLQGIVPSNSSGSHGSLGYTDYCNAQVNGVVDKSWTCCKAKFDMPRLF